MDFQINPEFAQPRTRSFRSCHNRSHGVPLIELSEQDEVASQPRVGPKDDPVLVGANVRRALFIPDFFRIRVKILATAPVLAIATAITRRIMAPRAHALNTEPPHKKTLSQENSETEKIMIKCLNAEIITTLNLKIPLMTKCRNKIQK